MALRPSSFGFTLLLGLLAALPSFGIDMVLPALTATGAALGVSPSAAGLTMSAFVLSLGVAPLVYGPVSDRFGRKPVVVFGCMLLVIASVGCGLAQSLPALLAWRVVQGAGAASTTMMAIAITRDLFDGPAGRAKMSYIVVAINVVPMIAPSAGAALLRVGDWRLLYFALVAVGLILLLAMWFGFEESAGTAKRGGLRPGAIARTYLRVLTHPLCAGYILVNAAAMGAIFAYATGSSLYLINGVGLRPDQYGLIFGASAVAVMAGALLDSRLATRGVAPGASLVFGLGLLAAASLLLLGLTLAGWMKLPGVIALMIAVTFAFGLVAPNAMSAAMQPLPQHAGSVSAVAGFVQMMAAAGCSGIVTLLFDGHSALSMAGVMAVSSVVAVGFYGGVVRPAERARAADWPEMGWGEREEKSAGLGP